MDRVISDDVPTADVLWYAAERIGKSSNGDEIQKICDYLVNKHWFQTAGDLRMAQLATEEWHSLQIPSRLKIAVQQVLGEAHYHQQQPQGGSPYGYVSYCATAAQGEGDQQATWPIDQSTAAGYEGYYYSQEASTSTAEAEQYAQREQYDMTDESASGASHDYGAETTGVSSPANSAAHRADLYASDYYSQIASPMSTSEDITDHQVSSEDYFSYHHRHHRHHQEDAHAEESEVVEAHAVVVEEATTCEEILAPIPIQQWGCRQRTYLNPISESFCEMCRDHISASPDMAGVSFGGAPPATATTTPKQIAPYSGGSEPAGYASPPAYEHALAVVAAPTHPMSPLYSPSAPPYDETMECEDDENLPQAVLLPPAPIVIARPAPQGSATPIPSELVKQLATSTSAN